MELVNKVALVNLFYLSCYNPISVDSRKTPLYRGSANKIPSTQGNKRKFDLFDCQQVLAPYLRWKKQVKEEKMAKLTKKEFRDGVIDRCFDFRFILRQF